MRIDQANGMACGAATAPAEGDVAPGSWFVLAVLTLVMAVSYADRFALAILIQPIKGELGLTDTEIGLLTGLAFSLFYAACSLPIARLADRGSRRALLIASLTAWSVMTGLTGLVVHGWQLFVARFGVGAGEAGSVPASYSLIADLFPPTRRASALALFTAGGPAGMLLAFAAGGWLGAQFGWRTAFLLLALPGLALALVLALFVREPARHADHGHAAPEAATLDVLRRAAANRRLLHALLGYSVSVLLLYGQMQWLPAFFQRSFAVEGTALGLSIAMTRGLGTIAGLIAGGWLADRLRRHDARWPGRIIVGGNLVALAPQAAMLLVRDLDLAYAFSTAAGILTALGVGPLTAAIQAEAAPHERATIGGIMLLLSAILGMGGGPLLVGALSDLFAAGDESLRWALLATIAFAGPWMMLHLVLAQRAVRDRYAP